MSDSKSTFCHFLSLVPLDINYITKLFPCYISDNFEITVHFLLKFQIFLKNQFEFSEIFSVSFKNDELFNDSEFDKEFDKFELSFKLQFSSFWYNSPELF